MGTTQSIAAGGTLFKSKTISRIEVLLIVCRKRKNTIIQCDGANTHNGKNGKLASRKCKRKT